MSATAKYRAQGCNCAEAIIKAYNEQTGEHLPVRAATAFGGGLSCGAMCGAAVGALMTLGMRHGRDEGSERNEAGPTARAFMKKLEERYGCLDCRDLKKRGVPCDEIVEFAYQTMAECVKNAEDK